LAVDVTTPPEFTHEPAPRAVSLARRLRGNHYGVRCDPGRSTFVMAVDTREVPPPVKELYVVLNWFDELERIVR